MRQFDKPCTAHARRVTCRLIAAAWPVVLDVVVLLLACGYFLPFHRVRGRGVAALPNANAVSISPDSVVFSNHPHLHLTRCVVTIVLTSEQPQPGQTGPSNESVC